MRGEPSCPKCGGRVRAPGLFADAWQCSVHGQVHPMQPVIPPSVEGLGVVVHRAQVPVWMPWPLPVGWLFTGVASAGDDRSGGRASAVARPVARLLMISRRVAISDRPVISRPHFRDQSCRPRECHRNQHHKPHGQSPPRPCRNVHAA